MSPVTNYFDSNGTDLGDKLIPKDYLNNVYPNLAESVGITSFGLDNWATYYDIGPTYYNFTDNGITYSFDDKFIPKQLFQSGNLWTWGKLDEVHSTFNGLTPTKSYSPGINWKQVSCGEDFFTAIRSDGTLWCWGQDNVGQVLGSIGQTSVPVQEDDELQDWIQVASGGQYSVAIKSNGTLWGWGENTYGEVGDGTFGQKITPVQEATSSTDWVKVRCGYQTTLGIKTDGTLWGWGQNGQNQFGDGTTISQTSPTQIGTDKWKDVDCGGTNSVGIKTDGTLWRWGFSNGGSTPVQEPSGSTDWKQVSCGEDRNAAIKNDGSLWVWGTGPLGLNDTLSYADPTEIYGGGNNWKSVVCGGEAFAAIKTDGTLWMWGKNFYGQLASGDTIDKLIPNQVSMGGNKWKQVFITKSQFNEYECVGAVEYIEPVI